MPTSKDLKRLTRARMKKTGESYTTARSQLLAKRERPAVTAVEPDDWARIAGMSDAALAKATGRDWRRWVRALDRVEASAMSHREIAGYVHDTYEVSGWWAQMVTVGYERIKGLRERGQRRDGGYEASKSKTFPVPVKELFRAFSASRMRGRWLPGVRLTVTKSSPPRSMRVAWEDGSRVAFWFTDKGGKSAVAVQHLKLPKKADAERMKAYWGERLRGLAELLG